MNQVIKKRLGEMCVKAITTLGKTLFKLCTTDGRSHTQLFGSILYESNDLAGNSVKNKAYDKEDK